MLANKLEEIRRQRLVRRTVLRTLRRTDQRGCLDQTTGHRKRHRAVVPVHDARNVITGSGGDKNRRDRSHDEKQNYDLEVAPHVLHIA